MNKVKHYLLICLMVLALYLCSKSLLAGITSYQELLNSNLLIKLLPILTLLVIYRILNGLVFNDLINSVAVPCNSTKALILWLRAETFKWLPGGVGNLVAKIHQLKKHTVASTSQATAITLLDSIVNLLAWGLSFLTFAVAIDWRSLLHSSSWLLSSKLIIIISALALVILTLVVAKTVSQKTNTLYKKLSVITSLNISYSYILASLIKFYALVLFNGYLFYLLVNIISPLGMVSLPQAIAINSLAWLAGFLAVLAPGGLGVREGVITALLVSSLGLPTTLFLCVAWRSIQMLSELLALSLLIAPQYFFSRDTHLLKIKEL